MPSDVSALPLRVHVDVTDAVATRFAAGIQRVARRLAQELERDDRVELVPMVWSAPLAAFRHLDPAEHAVLFSDSHVPAAEPVDPTAGRGRLGVAVRRVRRALVGLLDRAGLKDPLGEVVRRVGLATVHRDQRSQEVTSLAGGSVLLELDAVWNVVRVDRDELYRSLRARGVRVAALVYDLLPQEHPSWFESPAVAVTGRYLRAVARHADVVFAISQHTARSFVDWAGREGLSPVEPSVVTLGATMSERGRRAEALPAELRGRRYVLVVGTVEPRKNHATLLDAHERLGGAGELHLVVVGRPGWRNDEVIARLEEASASRPDLWWYRDADDELLGALYEHAHLVAAPSLTEGWGLPIVEALAHGVPVVASSGGAQPEAGGELVQYVEPLDVEGWVGALRRHVEDPSHHEAAVAGSRSFRAPTWGGTAGAVVARLLEPAPVT